MSHTQHLFFDLDGPVLDVSTKYYQVYFDLVVERGGRPIPKAEYWAFKQRRVPDEMILRLSGITGWSEDYRRLRKTRIETQEYLRYDRVWPGVIKMLHDLRARYLLVLVTLRHSREGLLWELNTLGLSSLFHHVLSTDAPGRGRAEAKVALVRKALGAGRFCGWFIGDTETDIRAGQMLGLRTAAVAFGIRTAEPLMRLMPDVLLQSPQELVAWATAHEL